MPIRTLKVSVSRSHPGQQAGSARKKLKRQERREEIAGIAKAYGASVAEVLQAKQQEANRLITEAERYKPKPPKDPPRPKNW